MKRLFTTVSLLIFATTLNAANFAHFKSITLEQALDISVAMSEKAKEEKVHVTITVLGADGRSLITMRDEKSGFAPLEWAKHKALSSYQTTKQTKDLGNGDGFKVLRVNDFSFVPGLPGGIPLLIEGERVGAIGVSGAPVAIDQKIAEVGLSVFEEMLK